MTHILFVDLKLLFPKEGKIYIKNYCPFTIEIVLVINLENIFEQVFFILLSIEKLDYIALLSDQQKLIVSQIESISSDQKAGRPAEGSGPEEGVSHE